jgi:succinate dehydrogenase/fumarate reductase flavoprotein subunit
MGGYMSTEKSETDVLVVVSGAAGLFAAIRAKETGARVIVVEKGQSGFSGASAYGPQYIRITFPGDDYDKSAKQTIVWSDYLADQDIINYIVRESYDRFEDLLKWGVNFIKDQTGEIKSVVGDSPYDTECKIRFVFPGPPGSPDLVSKMRKEALRLGAEFIDRVMVTDLLTSDSKVVGAVGFNTRKGSFCQFTAKSVIIATGSFILGPPTAYVWYSGPSGMMMALRAGAELRNMEQGRNFTCSDSPQMTSMSSYYWDHSKWWGQKFVNAKGEEFMEKYELGCRLPGRKHWPPHYRLFIPAIVREWREGKGPCYLDLSECPNYWERMRDLYDGYLDRFVREWDELAEARGVSPLREFWREKFEMTPGSPGGDARGGIRVDANAQTGVPGLYAAGIASDMDGGALYGSATSLVACFASGHRAGINAAEYAKTQPKPVVSQEQVKVFEREMYAPLERKQGITPDNLRAKLAQVSYRYCDIIKNGARLKKGVEELEKLRDEARTLVAKDAHYLQKCHNTRDTVELWSIMTKTALMRTESRCDHYREDYPLMDNDNWLKWLLVRSVNGEPQIASEDIPFEERNWKYRPTPGKINIWRER